MLYSHVQNEAPKIYMDCLLHTSDDSFNDGIKYLEAILDNLKKAGMQFNAWKGTLHATASEFRVPELLMMLTHP